MRVTNVQYCRMLFNKNVEKKIKRENNETRT